MLGLARRCKSSTFGQIPRTATSRGATTSMICRTSLTRPTSRTAMRLRCSSAGCRRRPCRTACACRFSKGIASQTRWARTISAFSVRTPLKCPRRIRTIASFPAWKSTETALSWPTGYRIACRGIPWTCRKRRNGCASKRSVARRERRTCSKSATICVPNSIAAFRTSRLSSRR